MVSYKDNSRGRRSWPWWRRVLTVLSIVGLALSAFLGWHYLVGGSVIGCSGGGSCDEVLSGRWSAVGGVLPVSGLAAGTYLALLMAGLFIGPATETHIRRLAWSAMLVLAGAVAGSAVWFIIVQKWIIGLFCAYCMATHITGLLLAALIIWRASAADTVTQRVIGHLPATGLVLVGLAIAGIMAICQIHFVPPAVYRSGELQNKLPAIDSHAAPLVGPPDAPYVVNMLFDYNCPHCQELHLMLDEAVRRYGGKLAFVLCPTPLNTKCNPYIPRDVNEFADSCELAKIALTVWVAKREVFPVFDRWMFSFESGDRWQPRSPAAARAKAVELVGQTKFDAALTDPWIEQYLQTSIRIYGNTVQGGNNAVPKLVFGPRWIIAEPNDPDDLVLILHNRLTVPKP